MIFMWQTMILQATPSADPYEFVANVPAVNGYIGDIIVDQRIDYGFLPRSIDGSQTSDFHDSLVSSKW